MKFSNYHQHTTFSDGKHSPEEVVMQAIELGVENLGFSDHLATPYEISVGFNGITTNSYERYHAEIERLKKLYQGKIRLFCGVELDAFSQANNQIYDYTIGSVHYLEYNGKTYPVDHNIKLQNEYLKEVCLGDLNKFAKDYYNQVFNCIQKFKPNIIGHFDVLNKFSLFDENDRTYKKIATETLEKCLKITPVLEMNTGAISRGYKTYPYPASFLLGALKELNADIILSSDAHNKYNTIYFFEECVKILKVAGFKHIVKFTDNQFEKIEL